MCMLVGELFLGRENVYKGILMIFDDVGGEYTTSWKVVIITKKLFYLKLKKHFVSNCVYS